MPQLKYSVVLCALLALASCGSGSNPFDGPGEQDEEDTTTDPEVVEGVPEVLRGNVQSIAFDSENETLTVAITSLDTTPFEAQYVRLESLDVPGYMAFGVQEDQLDRLFLAFAAQSQDGAVQAGTVSDGGQFNIFFPGGFYSRDGDFDAPDIGEGPAAGQVSYAGDYVGLTNVGPSVAVDPGTPDVLAPEAPGTITGDIFLNANFADMSINGAVYNRVLIDFGMDLRDIVLLPSDINENGEFLGSVEFDGDVGNTIGDFGGIIGGDDAASIAGLVVLTEYEEEFENEFEQGVFVLSQCNQPNAPSICDQVAQ